MTNEYHVSWGGHGLKNMETDMRKNKMQDRLSFRFLPHTMTSKQTHAFVLAQRVSLRDSYIKNLVGAEPEVTPLWEGWTCT